MDDTAQTTSPREPDGRFAAGNPGGPGRPKGRRQTEQRRAVEEAVTPEMLRLAMRKCASKALLGDLQALRILLERTCGRVADAPLDAEPLGPTLPPLRTAADCAAAMERVVKAICAGTIEEASARLLIDAITARMKAIELTDHEVRLAEIEKMAGAVDMRGRAV